VQQKHRIQQREHTLYCTWLFPFMHHTEQLSTRPVTAIQNCGMMIMTS